MQSKKQLNKPRTLNPGRFQEYKNKKQTQSLEKKWFTKMKKVNTISKVACYIFTVLMWDPFIQEFHQYNVQQRQVGD